ncbi:right-handed parallel beta-helix repeat-containing protein [Geomonas sp. RF6]|uniref:right-handed parallel beta-helix repeat-containing protein n=1 Tax=Geomonas sp. RF6 TaxID=2897342 RepID=UPI001E5CCD54|nr:right-handed parallel beta-helix repeat-containing protein [Geomonas sp. RF6]UFS70321.1 right-handed parallel beta-helix repeat-containing protein [Geomonas sp. RF6]
MAARLLVFIAVSLLLQLIPLTAHARVLTSDTTWKGEVIVEEDILVPDGVTLTIAPGTTVKVGAAESSKTDPEYLSPLTEITVRGVLRAEGDERHPILFQAGGERKESAWAGIIVDGGESRLAACRIESAESGVYLLRGRLRIDGSTVTGNRYGIVLQGRESTASGARNSAIGNDYGLLLLSGAPRPKGLVELRGNRKKDEFSAAERGGAVTAVKNPPQRQPRKESADVRVYHDEVLAGETVWRGMVRVDGTLRVPQGSRLVILPGTTVEFTFRDTNGDGIGENGLLVQGIVVAKGSAASPILFRGADRSRRGSWDSINIMNSAGPWNLFEHCIIEDAYRGLHFHFSRVALTDSEISNCYRAVQFQEATVIVRGNRFFGNKSAVQGRDSDLSFDENSVSENQQGANFLRVRLKARGNRIMRNVREGIRIREGATVFEENLVEENRFGILVQDASFPSFERNAISNNLEIGASIKNGDNLLISGNFISGNGINGVNLNEVRGAISGNLVSDNGERGIGIQSFSGTIEGNNFAANGLCAIDPEGKGEVAAPRNWWGGSDARSSICTAPASAGTVLASAPASQPLLFPWPLSFVPRETTWRGTLSVAGKVAVPTGSSLTVTRGTTVGFGAGGGLSVTGRIVAAGDAATPVLFTSAGRKEGGAWDEILLEHADGSSFTGCVFEYAGWGVHSHFTKLSIKDSLFHGNDGGMRFRSGPVTISGSVFTENGIGVRSFRGNAVISGNVFTGNGVGIFVREKGSGLQVEGNNLSGNADYNMRLGDFNNEDVAAPGNWWGSAEPAESIYDAGREPGIGTVRYQPVVSQALSGVGSSAPKLRAGAEK